MATNRLPIVSGDNGAWGTYLNNFLQYAHVSYVSSGNPTAFSQGGALSYVSKITTTTYTIGSTTYTTGNETVLADAATAGGAITIIIPSAVSWPGIIHTVKKIDTGSNTVTLSSAGGSIDGASTAVIKVPYASITVASDGTNWYIV